MPPGRMLPCPADLHFSARRKIIEFCGREVPNKVLFGGGGGVPMSGSSETFLRFPGLALAVVFCAHALWADEEKSASSSAPSGAVAMPAGAAAPAGQPVPGPGARATPGEPGKPGDAAANPSAPGSKPGEAAKPAEGVKPVQRPAKPDAPPKPEELKVQPDKTGKFRLSFNGQPWPAVLEWLAEKSGMSLDWQELPGDYLNLTMTQRSYTIREVRHDQSPFCWRAAIRCCVRTKRSPWRRSRRSTPVSCRGSMRRNSASMIHTSLPKSRLRWSS